MVCALSTRCVCVMNMASHKTVLVPKTWYDEAVLFFSPPTDLQQHHPKKQQHEQYEQTNEQSSKGISPRMDCMLFAFGKRQKEDAFRILRHLNANGATINDKGELSFVDGTTLTGTHCVDLIKSLLFGSKHRPQHADLFLKKLKKSHMPSSFVKNVMARDQYANDYNDDDDDDNAINDNAIKKSEWITL